MKANATAETQSRRDRRGEGKGRINSVFFFALFAFFAVKILITTKGAKSAKKKFNLFLLCVRLRGCI
jgi:hypothetical protein